jgi:glycosyltransferase involved in cell wall biosynthesis
MVVGVDDRPAGGPRVSVVLCTYNPRADLLAEVLGALARQTLPPRLFEVVVVDNNSTSPVEVAGQPFATRVVREPNPGLNHARRKGIEEARADLLVFVDDDNILDPDYLETALRIADADPSLGAYGGLARGRLERADLPRWKLRLLDKLGVRDNGPVALTSAVDRWGPWEPIGAGLVLRRVVAEHFLHLMGTSPHAPRLDRSGPTGLMSGGDTLMARSAYRVGLSCSYQPGLRLTHVIKGSRFDTKYLFRILHAHGKSVVVLNRALGVPVPRMTLPGLVLRFPYRLITRGLRGGVMLYAWDLGYYREAHRAADAV